MFSIIDEQYKNNITMNSSSEDESETLQAEVDVRTELVLDEEQNIKVPGTIAQHLKEYQKAGILFLHRKFKKNKGAILADEMEEGKAVQVVALLAALLRKTGGESDAQYCVPQAVLKEWNSQGEGRPRLVFLLVAPANILNAWAQELQARISFIVERFSKTERSSLLNRVQNKTVEVVLCSTESVRNHSGALAAVEWDGVIVDEIHRINTSQLSTALRKIQCPRRIGLMSQLTQSNMLELWNVLDWANPGIFGTKLKFIKKWERPIELGQRADADEKQQSLAKKRLAEFSRRRRWCMLKRTKPRSLARKTEQILYCQMGSRQQEIYEHVLKSKETQMVLKQDENCSCGSLKPQHSCCFKKDETGRTIKQLTFSLLQLLRKICNHIGLLCWGSRGTSYNLLSSILEQQGLSATQLKGLDTDPKSCGKIQVLAKLLQRFSEEESKVLLFSSSSRILEFLESLVKDSGYRFLRLDGSTPVSERPSMIDNFNNDDSVLVLLISTKLRGRYLNTITANRVVVFEPMWNPSDDQQAQERAYTTEEDRDVEVYRLITSGTIEENIYLRQLYKQQLAKAATSSKWSDGASNKSKTERCESMKDELFGWKSLFSLKPGLTKSLLEQQESAERSRLEDLYSLSYEEREEDVYDPLGQMQDVSELKNIFRSSGVIHTHEHQAVLARPCKVPRKEKRMDMKEEDGNVNSSSGFVGDQCGFYGRTPVKEMMRQFTQIANQQGISESELSSRVLAATDEERLELLRDFYGPQFPR